jgi:uncharacterized protein (DUF302 family)
MRLITTVATTVAAILLAAIASAASAADGMLVLESPYDAKTTMDRLEEQVEARDLKVFARIDHAAGAAKIGKELRPTELIVFGNPQGGTPFMTCEQTIGIDLPLKALVWEDAEGRVWLGWNDPAFIAERHGVSDCPQAAKVQRALQGLADAVVEP